MKASFLYFASIAFALFISGNMVLATMVNRTSLETRHRAISNVALESIDIIKLDIDQVPNLTNIYLYEAIKQHRLNLIELILEHVSKHHQDKFDTNVLNLEHGKMRLLSVAILHRHGEMVEWMIKNGANPNISDTGSRKKAPVHYAFEFGVEHILWLLSKHGADMNAKDASNKTCLHYACSSGCEKIVNIAIQMHMDLDAIDVYGRTPLHYACKYGAKAIVLLLIEKGAKLDVLDKSNMTPLHHARKSGNVDIVRILLEHGAKADTLDNNNKTPLHWKYEFGNKTLAHVLSAIELPVDIVDKECMESSPLALKPTDKTFERHLLRQPKCLSSNADILEHQLLKALKKRHYDIVKLFIEHGANFRSITPQWLAYGVDDKRKIELFLANPNLFYQLTGPEQTDLLMSSSYIGIVDVNLPNHIISARLGCLFMLFSINTLREIRERCNRENVGYHKFMFTQARLFLQQGELYKGQDSESASILKQVFGVIFKEIDTNTHRLRGKLDAPCNYLAGPLKLLSVKENHTIQRWIRGYLRYPWAFKEATQTNFNLAAVVLAAQISVQASHVNQL